ncbi:MAG: non-ribosomal peptide synthetase, partial [Gammaproteobacteria bacterium]|nr:non-ribosomal peptide synthetase [Gammaproteobacteria bacterium]
MAVPHAVDFIARIQALLSEPLAGREQESLIELGLDSLHIMRLVNDWRRAGIPLTFAQLIERPYLSHWLELLDTLAPQICTEATVDEPGCLDPSAQIEDTEAFGLTDVQHAYWVGRQDGQPLGGVGCHAYLELEGQNIEPTRLERAWRRLFLQHAMLRTRFGEDGTQRLCQDLVAPPLRTHDFRQLSERDAQASLLAVRDDLSHRRLDVANGEVAGLALSLLPDGGTCIHFDIDLLVADVQSLHILLRDLAAAYQGQELGADPGWRFSRYLEIAASRDGEQRLTARKYWQDCLAQLPPGPQLPLAKAPEHVTRPCFVRRCHQLPSETWQILRGLATRHGATPAMMLATVYAEILGRWSQEPEFSLNLPLFDRKTDHPGIEQVVADFTNLLLLRSDCRKASSFAQRMRELQQQFHRDVAHASYSAVQVQRDLIKHGLAEGVMAPVVFACNLGTPLLTPACKATLGRLRYMVSQTPQVWLDHQIYEDEEGLLLAWDAVDELFPEGMLDDMFRAYCDLLAWLAKDADHWRQPLPQLLPGHQQQARMPSGVDHPLVNNTLLHAGMFAIAGKEPDRAALIANGAVCSYGVLAQRALQVAALLRRCDLAPGEAVAVSLPRGFDQIA